MERILRDDGPRLLLRAFVTTGYMPPTNCWAYPIYTSAHYGVRARCLNHTFGAVVLPAVCHRDKARMENFDGAEFLKLQYQALREEILATQRRGFQIIGVGLIALPAVNYIGQVH